MPNLLFDSWGFMWPGFLLAPAIGLFEFYWFGLRNRYLLIPITILTGLSILFFAAFTLGAIFNYLVVSGPVIAIALVVIGAFTLLGGKSKA